MTDGRRGALHGLRVLDISTVIAGPNCARYLADFGADVIKVERLGGDSLRTMGWRHPDGTGLWSKHVNRNKRTIALDLKLVADRDVLLGLVDDAHVLVENFRPGTLERLGLGPDVLLARRPSLVITRISGFGQTGPYAGRPGFATTAESMSGFAAVNGEPDGPPLLPPIALTDEITGITAAFATMVAVHAGVGQVIDVNLLETMLQMMSPLPSVFGTLGELQPRMGSALPYSVPRGAFKCADGRYLGISASSDTVAQRLMELLGVGGDPRFETFASRAEHRDDIDAVLASWCATRTRDQAVEELTAANAAVGPILTMAEVATDPHVVDREALITVDHTAMPGVVARLSETPGAVRWAGRGVDADADEIRTTGWLPVDTEDAEGPPEGGP